MNLKFRDLRADEIDVRVSQINDKGCSLLLYKDARCDMNILDETVGAENWQRAHTRDNANCIVSIWDDSKGQWISKEDTGTESKTEQQKGLASDSFKRACFNWGIGRELYTAPFIYVKADNVEITSDKGKFKTNDKFYVSSIKIENHVIKSLEIGRTHKYKDMGIVYRSYGQKANPAPKPQSPADEKAVDELSNDVTKMLIDEIVEKAARTGTDIRAICQCANKADLSEFTAANCQNALKILNKKLRKLEAAQK